MMKINANVKTINKRSMWTWFLCMILLFVWYGIRIREVNKSISRLRCVCEYNKQSVLWSIVKIQKNVMDREDIMNVVDFVVGENNECGKNLPYVKKIRDELGVRNNINITLNTKMVGDLIFQYLPKLREGLYHDMTAYSRSHNLFVKIDYIPIV